ncbi:MAG TPA: 23S rRNA (uracil(1939)-C(5))-methyltransferase RlmD [Thermotogota bacterium]|jgi:23S rRNA (uracil1939-C5)-methyltransferase|nr:23S rRNA (uracil(1939)-C(5))-methyltransferase RlmD [Thermotogota bacterium]HPN28583.1 23S rRNA (uracil(1939)-C(5))-methyltransferase RlmD [Thermotogota bacterium]
MILAYENEITIGSAYQIVIEKLVFGGYGLGYIEGSVPVFIESAYPGEIVRATIASKSRGAFFGTVQDWIYRVPERNGTVCSVFNQCGSCEWLDYDYQSQLKAKKELLREQFLRIGKLDIMPVLFDVIPSKPYGYRNKMEYAFRNVSGAVVLGLKRKKSHDVVPTRGCKIVPEGFERIRKTVESFANRSKTPTPVYDRSTKRGALKDLVVRTNADLTRWMVIVVTDSPSFKGAADFVKTLREECPFVTSIIHLKNSSDKVVLRGAQSTLYGEGVLAETLGWFQYHVPSTAFFQSNRALLEPLLELVKTELELEKDENLLDLYAGIGFFSIYLAPLVKYVLAVEGNSVAAKAIVKNMRLNQLSNVRAIQADIEKADLTKVLDRKVSKVILDPPRAGISTATAQGLAALAPEKILYLSCDPATLARDIAILVKNGYFLRKVQPIDMFPHTSHVETAVSMSRVKD